MAIDSRAKGRTAELKARDVLRKYTGLEWERTPLSGALSANHKLKGDLYLPDRKNTFSVEVKSYKDDHLTSKILSGKSPQFLEWWDQAERQAVECDKLPLLLFKFNRSKWFVATGELYSTFKLDHICIYKEDKDACIYVYILEDWLRTMKPTDFT